jgi:hypothetical protein
MWISLKTLPIEYKSMEDIVASKVGVFLGVNSTTFFDELCASMWLWILSTKKFTTPKMSVYD